MTRKEIKGNSILFLFAGFQTTADTMMFIFYELAHHPDSQQKVMTPYIYVNNTTTSLAHGRTPRQKYSSVCVGAYMHACANLEKPIKIT